MHFFTTLGNRGNQYQTHSFYATKILSTKLIFIEILTPVKFFKFLFLGKKSKTLLAFFEQSCHFWTWKMQNLKSRHQN